MSAIVYGDCLVEDMPCVTTRIRRMSRAASQLDVSQRADATCTQQSSRRFM